MFHFNRSNSIRVDLRIEGLELWRGDHCDVLQVEPATWENVLEKLDEQIATFEEKALRGGIHVTVPSSWCRTWVEPWNSQFLSTDAIAPHLTQSFETAFGGPCEEWALRAEDAPYGKPRLVCAMKTDFIEALKGIASKYGVRLLSMRPAALAALKALARRNNVGNGPVVVVEDGLLALYSFEDERIVTVVQERWGQSWQRSLSGALQRAMLRQPGTFEVEDVWVINLSRTIAQAPLLKPFRLYG